MKRIELLRMRLLKSDAPFTEEKLKKRADKVYSELKLLYPKLASESQCRVDRRYLSDGDYIMLIVDLEESPQDRLKYSQVGKVGSDDATHLEGIAKVILESAHSVQERIYREAQDTNLGMAASLETRSKNDRSFGAMLGKRRNTQLVVETSAGQDRFDFPDIVGTISLEHEVAISGYVQWVGRRGFRVSAFKIHDHGDGQRLRLAYRDKKDVLFNLDKQDVYAIAEVALKAAIDRRRIFVRVYASIRTLTGTIDHFTLQTPNIEFVSRES